MSDREEHLNEDPDTLTIRTMARNLEHLGHLIASGSRIAWQDDQYHVFLPSGDGYASGKTMWHLVFNMRDAE